MAVRPLPSGELKTLLTFVEPVRTGIVGEETLTWPIRFKRPAKGGAMSGREFINALATEAELTHKFELRYDSDMARVRTTWRALLGDRTLEIVHIADVEEAHVKFELVCKELG